MTAAVETNLYRMLAATAARRPEATAFEYEDTRLSYGELLSLVDDAAEWLSEADLGRGQTFAAFSQNRPELILAYYAAAKLGAVFVPINPNMTASEVAYAFKDSEAKVLFHDEFVEGTAAEAVPLEHRRAIADLARPFKGVPAATGEGVDPSDDFVIIYTSGTTGAPKAIVLDQIAQAGAGASLTQLWNITDQDTTVVVLPLGFLYGLSTATGVGLQAGGKVRMLRRFRPGDVLEALCSAQASVFHGVPTMFSMMLEYTEQRGLSFDLSGIRLLISAGAPLPEELRDRFRARFNKEIQNYYAMTESTPIFGAYATDPALPPPGSVGKLAPGVAVRIVDPEGADCPPGTPGEMLVRGPATVKRYNRQPELTRSVFSGGLFRSGDVGYRDEAGYFYITGRIKDIIIRGGANIAPAEVEHVLISHPGVQDAAVLGIPDRIFGEVPIAFVIRRHAAEVSAEELTAYAERDLADFKVPRQYYFLDEFPMGKTGKIDKVKLRTAWIESQPQG